MTTAAGCSTFASNISDWSRNATKPSDVPLGQLVGAFHIRFDFRTRLIWPFTGFPLSNFVVQVLGMVVGSTSVAVYGQLVFNPCTYLDMLLTDNYDAAHRAGAFFIALGFTYSLLFSCVFEVRARSHTDAEDGAFNAFPVIYASEY